MALRPKRVSTLQATVLLSVATICIGLFTVPTLGMNAVGRSPWLPPVLGFVMTLWGTFVLSKVAGREPRKSLALISQKIIGKPLGILFSAVAVAYFLVDVAIGIRMMAVIESYSLLPMTPLPVLAFLILVAVGYAVWLGIEVIARVGQIVGVVLAGPLVLFLMVGPWFYTKLEFDHLRPLFDFRPDQVLSIGFLSSLFIYRCMAALTAINPSLDRPRDFFKIGAWSVGVTVPFFVVVALYPVMAFGWPTANFYFWPFWQLAVLLKARAIPIERPIYLLEASVHGVTLVTATVFLYSACVYTKDVLGIKSWRPPLYAFLPIVFALLLIPEDAIDFITYINYWLVLGVGLWIVTPTVMWLVAMLKDLGEAERQSRPR